MSTQPSTTTSNSMRRVIAGVVSVVLGFLPAPAFAQQPSGGSATVASSPSTALSIARSQPISDGMATAVAAFVRQDAAGATTTTQEPAERSWVGRHAALVGLLAGAGAGAGIGYALGHDCSGATEACSSKAGAAVAGAAIFGGIGAFTGWLISRGTR